MSMSDRKALQLLDQINDFRTMATASGAQYAVAFAIAKNALREKVNRAVRCSYCDPSSQDYNPCWLCKKGGTAHDVEHCHKTNYGDYEPMQPHCHLCGRKL